MTTDKATERPWRRTPIHSDISGRQYIEIEHPTGPKTCRMICQIDTDYLCAAALNAEDEANADLIVDGANAYPVFKQLVEALIGVSVFMLTDGTRCFCAISERTGTSEFEDCGVHEEPCRAARAAIAAADEVVRSKS